MIASNPYNLPDKILKSNPQVKTIPLQNKKSRDRSFDFSKQLSSKGIKIQSKMKKSLNLHHVTSSPNLHTPSTSSSTNRHLEPPTLSRHVEYVQNSVQPSPETQNDRRIKFLFEKFYQIQDQLNAHDSFLLKLTNQKDQLRRSWDSPFQFNNPLPHESREREELIRSQQRNLNSTGYLSVNSIANQPNGVVREIDQLKKQISYLRQQISNIKTTMGREKDQENNLLNSSRSIKFNSIHDHEIQSLQKKFGQDFSRVCHALQQIRISTNQKFIKIQNSLTKIDGNGQILSQKVNKAQQKIQNTESNIENHMKLVNQEINISLTKIVASINEKISKALENNIVLVNEKLKKCIQTCKNLKNQEKIQASTLKPSNLEGKIQISKGILLKLSGYKAEGKTLKIRMKSLLTVNNEANPQKSGFFSESNSKKSDYSSSKSSTQADQITLSDAIYHIDSEGYLMDENRIYLMDENNNLLQLDSEKLAKIKGFGVF